MEAVIFITILSGQKSFRTTLSFALSPRHYAATRWGLYVVLCPVLRVCTDRFFSA